MVNDEVMEDLDKIKVYPVQIGSEEDLVKDSEVGQSVYGPGVQAGG